MFQIISFIRRPRPIALAAAVVLAVGVASCNMVTTTGPSPTPQPTASATESGSGAAVSFAGQVQPIFTARCIGCHQPGGIAFLAGITMDLREGGSRDQIVNVPSEQRPDLTRVVPGDSASSLLFLKVSSDRPPVGSRMPLGGPFLSVQEQTLIRDWIDQGALDN